MPPTVPTRRVLLNISDVETANRHAQGKTGRSQIHPRETSARPQIGLSWGLRRLWGVRRLQRHELLRCHVLRRRRFHQRRPPSGWRRFHGLRRFHALRRPHRRRRVASWWEGCVKHNADLTPKIGDATEPPTPQGMWRVETGGEDPRDVSSIFSSTSCGAPQECSRLTCCGVLRCRFSGVRELTGTRSESGANSAFSLGDV